MTIKKTLGSPTAKSKMMEQLVQRRKIQEESNKKGFLYIKGDCKLPQMKINKKDEDYFVDILPWMAGPNDPHVEEGKWQYVLNIHVHYHDGKNYVCPKAWGAHECPFCQERKRLLDEGEPKEVWLADPYKMKKRDMYQVWDVSSEKTKSVGPQIMECSSFLMSEKISKIEKRVARPGQTLGEDEAYINYFDPEDGKTLHFKAEQAKNGQGCLQDGHKFIDRNYVIPPEILEACVDLASYIEVKSYDDLYFLLHGEHPANKSSKSQPSSKDQKKVEVQEEDADPDMSLEEVLEQTVEFKIRYIMDNEIPDEDGDIVKKKNLVKLDEEELDALIKNWANPSSDEAEAEPEESDDEDLTDILESSPKKKARYIVENKIPDAEGKVHSDISKVIADFEEDEMDEIIRTWFKKK